MTHMEFKSRVGADGVLKVALTLGQEEADREVRVIVEPMDALASPMTQHHNSAICPSPTAIASERVLSKDWLRPEEDEAWRDL